jgi:hypothetical protein
MDDESTPKNSWTDAGYSKEDFGVGVPVLPPTDRVDEYKIRVTENDGVITDAMLVADKVLDEAETMKMVSLARYLSGKPRQVELATINHDELGALGAIHDVLTLFSIHPDQAEKIIWQMLRKGIHFTRD